MAVHIGLSLIAMAIFLAGAAWARRPDLLAVHGRALFVDNPGLATLGLVSLGHQLGYFNILPLYMILILCVPALLWLAQIDRRLMLGCSALVYGLVRFYGWNLPSWPAPGVWFFDPFAWQLLFAIGIAIGLSLRDGFPPLSRSLLAFAALIVAASALVVIHGFGDAQNAWQPLRSALDLDKAQLGVGRLIHFLALAYLVYGFQLTDRLRGLSLYRPLELLGRHSLWVFAWVSLFSAVWQAVIDGTRHAPWFDILFAGCSLIVIYLATRMIDGAGASRRSADRSPRAARLAQAERGAVPQHHLARIARLRPAEIAGRRRTREITVSMGQGRSRRGTSARWRRSAASAKAAQCRCARRLADWPRWRERSRRE